MNFEVFYTNRILLRLINPDVYSYVFKHYPDAEIIDFMGFHSTEELNNEKEKYNKGIVTYDRSFLYFQLIAMDSNHIIGQCGYHSWYIKHQRAEVFYKLYKEEHKQKGIMTEVMQFTLNYGYNMMGLNRVEAYIEPDNTASIRLITKMNFVKEGLLRQHYNNNGIMEDSLVFSLLKEDFMNKKEGFNY